MKTVPIKRALLSVSDKAGIVEFAKNLAQLGIEIISTGGTSQLLRDANVPHKQVDEITQLPEMLDGRVKTLHPKVHGGILGKRDKHAAEAAKHGIEWIDLVVVNFYPFAAAIKKNPNMTWDEAIEFIDIGGPTMVRAAAKNFAWVSVVIDPADYAEVMSELRDKAGLAWEKRKELAAKVFECTKDYEAMIHDYFMGKKTAGSPCPKQLNLQLEKNIELRYGENPHQQACAYTFKAENMGIFSAQQHQGKPLSYNNMLDAEAAWNCVREFTAPACIIVKHANPCGAATAENIDEAYNRAYQADPISAFGGIIALNRPCTQSIAEAIATIFMEVVLAPSYSEEALALLATKPNLRVLQMSEQSKPTWEMRFITGGMLLQEKDTQLITAADLQVVTQLKPQPEDIDAMLFAWPVLKHIKSNAILIAKDNATIGIGAGQVSRIDAVDIAVRKAGERIKHAILASDAFFPFRDSIDHIAKTGIRAIIQPGGSVRDAEVINACNEAGIAMVFTGKRCFRH